MKTIEFRNNASLRVYNDYISRCRRVISILSEADQKDCLMEINSYIYEYILNHHNEDELHSLLNILERIGPPEVTLKEVVAAKKIEQAVKTFSLKHLLEALFLNLRNGTVYVILFFMTLLLAFFPVAIILKIIYPHKTGLWVGKGNFIIGIKAPQEGVNEVLGDFFIPVVIVTGVIFYFIIIFLLKIVKNKRP